MKIKPQIADIIAFIQQMHKLFKELKILHAQNVRAIEVSFANFQARQSAGETVHQDKKPSNVDALQMAIQKVRARLHKLHENVTMIPENLKDAEVAKRLPKGRRLTGSVLSLDPKVQWLLHYHDVIKLKMDDFAVYRDVLTRAFFAVKLYEVVEHWMKSWNLMCNQPLPSFCMEEFKTEINRVNSKAEELIKEAPNGCPILNELQPKVTDIVPFLDQLDLLSRVKMQERHWVQFRSCQQSGYHQGITIDELLQSGILKEKEKIKEITAASQGGSEMETNF